MSLLGGGRRKLLLGVAALGLVLAVFVGFLLFSDGGRDSAVRTDLLRIDSNAVYGTFGVFSVTNAGIRKIILASFATEINTNGQWTRFWSSKERPRTLKPGASGAAFAGIPEDGRKWRAQWSWLNEPTRFQEWRMRLREKAGSFLPALKPDPRTAWNFLRQTNYSTEFPR